MFGAEDGEDIITKEPGYATLAVDLKAVANTVRIAVSRLSAPSSSRLGESFPLTFDVLQWWGIKKEKVQGSIVVTASMAGYAGQAGLPM